MKYFSTPWLVALLAAVLLHAAFFIEFKNQDWSIGTPPKANLITPQLNIELLKVESSPQQTPKAVANKPQPSSTRPSQAAPTPGVTDTPAAPLAEPKTELNTSNRSANPEPDTSLQPAPLTDVSSDLSQTPIGLEDIQEQDKAPATTDLSNSAEKLNAAPEDWKQNSLLDINDMPNTSNNADPTDKVFSPTFKAQIAQAIKDQKAYKKGVVKPKTYDITEDADGTKYVNINGVCWKLPEPGSEEEWQVVLSGCAGQKDTFRFELNITTDILTPEQMELLPFGGTE